MSGMSELERMAAKYAREAARQDQNGMKEPAAANYQRAVEILTTLRNLSVDDLHSEIYEDNIRQYKTRIEQLMVVKETKTVRIEREDDFFGLTAKKPDVSLNDVVISDDTRKAIEESVILRMERPDLFKLGGVRGILLFGPPGCGKTLLSAAIANETNSNLFLVDAASVMSKWLGESEKNLAEIFERARSSATEGRPSIVFIDEVDTFGSVNSSEVGGELRTRNQLLNEMDNILDKKQQSHLFVVAATNKPWALDEPLLRRFQKRICLDLPDKAARLRLIEIFSREVKIEPGVDQEELASMTRGYSGSDIRDIFEAVESRLAREFMKSNQENSRVGLPRAAKKEDFVDVISKRRPSVSESTLSYYKKWTEAFGAL